MHGHRRQERQPLRRDDRRPLRPPRLVPRQHQHRDGVRPRLPPGQDAVRHVRGPHRRDPRTWDNDSVNDISALTVDADKKGRKLTDVVGGQAIAFNRALGGTVSALGYSATRPQRGEELLRCVGKTKKEHGTQVIPCDLTGGASGGPWLAGFSTTTGKGTLVSVNASLDSLTPTKMYGEILGATAKKVYDRAQKV
ncbi:trypsin-like serine peptidase [Streptomyces niveus]|uniref:trypsin-like serine peptidase n=1 Tax=Streptomyces niveus TaxID=193462 RepID=UPI003698FE85